MAHPSPLANILPGLLERLGLADTAAGWKAVSEWPTVAGTRIARVTRAVGFRDGTLHVEVEGSAWMHELGFLKPEIVRNLNRHLAAGVVKDVRFTRVQSSARIGDPSARTGGGGSAR